MKKLVTIAALCLCGCFAKVTVDKRPNLALPIYSDSSTNPVEYVIVDQGYKVKYMKVGFNTDIQSMSAEISTNKTVNFQLGGLHSNVATNAFAIKLEDLVKVAQLFRETGTNDVMVIDKATLQESK
jgi:hypothetical protein